MARAKRHYIAGNIWRITHRCHKREFLIKFSKDRRRYLQWLWEAKKRYHLVILNYMVTSNHIHDLLKRQKRNLESEQRVGRSMEPERHTSFENHRFPIHPILATKTKILGLKTPISGMLIDRYQKGILADPITKKQVSPNINKIPPNKANSRARKKPRC